MARYELPPIAVEDEEQPRKPNPYLEINVFGLAGGADQRFYFGTGLNYTANHNYWLEIIYGVDDIPVFYTRNFLHEVDYETPALRRADLQKFLDREAHEFELRGYLPETSICARYHPLVKAQDQAIPEGLPPQWVEDTPARWELDIAVDAGTVFERSSPDVRTIQFTPMEHMDADALARFLHTLLDELDAADAGKHPNPATQPYHPFAFAQELNRRTYDTLAGDYQEDYFSNRKIRKLFDIWQGHTPAGGRILDIGCGHGDPVVPTLLERGHAVTGLDASPKMLARARERFPAATFHCLAANQIEDEAAYDAACSFNSMLYLDPMDFYNALYRVHRALKPGGLLLLFGFDPSADACHLPMTEFMGQPIWSWKYTKKEAIAALEAHGLFQVWRAEKTTTVSETLAFAKRTAERDLRSGPDASITLPSPVQLPDESIREIKDPRPLISFAERVAYSYAIIARKI